jgi:hypothetical protein
LFALVLPLKFGYASLLGDILQLALGHLELRLEAEGVEFPVTHGGVVVRLRGVIRKKLIHGRRWGRVLVDEPEAEKIVRNRGKNLERVIRGDDDHCLRRAPARLPFASSAARLLMLLPAIGSWSCAGGGKNRLGLTKA